MVLKPRDGLVLKLLWLGLRNQWREMSLYHRLLFPIGSVLCLLWPLNDLMDFLVHSAVFLRSAPWVPVAALAVWAVLGAAVGRLITGLGLACANAPYLLVLPVSERERRRMVVFTALVCGLCTAPVFGMVLSVVCEIIHKPQTLLCGLAAALAYLASMGCGVAARLWRSGQRDEVRGMESPSLQSLALPPGLRRVDGGPPAWISSWATGLVAGRLPLSISPTLKLFGVVLLALVPSLASLARHQAWPAVIGAMFASLAAFMLAARCLPLRSPVLRTAPVGFMQAWFSMLRLPLLLSAVFFVVPAGAAIAAEPSAWTMNVSAGIGVLVLDGAYTIFAATFLMSPLLAACSFVGLAFYASYEWVTYHAVVYFCAAILLAVMAYRVRRSFYDGP